MLKRLIWALRVRQHECCGQKITYFLEREHQLRLSVPKSYEVLAEQYVIRSTWRKNQTCGAVPPASDPRAVLQMDTGAVGRVVAFTGIDLYTKEAAVMLPPGLTNENEAAFWPTVLAHRFTGRVAVRQTDGGPEYKGSFAQQALPNVPGIGMPGRPRRLSQPILNASTVPYAKNVWVGGRSASRICHA